MENPATCTMVSASPPSTSVYIQHHDPRPPACPFQVLKQIEADSGAYKLVVKTARNYVGFIAESQPDVEDRGVDIAIVYRGTITSKWSCRQGRLNMVS